MRKSDERILTTHVGSLPRDPVLSDLLIRDELGEKVDKAEIARLADKAVHHVVRQQTASGVDIVNDGEQPRVGFQTYVPQRMSGFAGVSKRRRGIEFEEFPELLAYLMRLNTVPDIALCEDLTVRMIGTAPSGNLDDPDVELDLFAEARRADVELLGRAPAR